MPALRPLLAAAIVAGSAQIANAQAPATPSRSSASVPTATRLTDPYMPSYSSRYQYRSRTAPHQPARDPDGEYGFRNPGGVGRMQEFYPPGNTFEQRGGGGNGGADPVRVAQFDNGPGATSRTAQLQSQMVGNARTRTLNEHIDAYSRPIGYGYGYGFGGTFGLFPY